MKYEQPICFLHAGKFEDEQVIIDELGECLSFIHKED